MAQERREQLGSDSQHSHYRRSGRVPPATEQCYLRSKAHTRNIEAFEIGCSCGCGVSDMQHLFAFWHGFARVCYCVCKVKDIHARILSELLSRNSCLEDVLPSTLGGTGRVRSGLDCTGHTDVWVRHDPPPLTNAHRQAHSRNASPTDPQGAWHAQASCLLLRLCLHDLLGGFVRKRAWNVFLLLIKNFEFFTLFLAFLALFFLRKSRTKRPGTLYVKTDVCCSWRSWLGFSGKMVFSLIHEQTSRIQVMMVC